MKPVIFILTCWLLAGCANTFHLPTEERSRTYSAHPTAVWDAALEAVEDAKLALVESEPEHGRIRARSAGSLWDLKGHVFLVVVRETNDGRVHVDANAEAISEETVVDFGVASRMVKRYLKALDNRMKSVMP